MNMRGVIAILVGFAALATILVAGAGAAGPSLTVGGNLVYAAIDPSDGMSDIYVQPPGGLASVNITHSADTHKDGSPVFAPNGSKIAFVRASAQGASIMVVNPNGTGLVNVTPLQLRRAINTDPSWSADGTRIAFSSNVDGNYDLYWIDASTAATQLSLPHRLTKTEAPVQNHDPSWAPNGKDVVFSRSGNGFSDSNSAELFRVEVAHVADRAPDTERWRAAATCRPSTHPTGSRSLFRATVQGTKTSTSSISRPRRSRQSRTTRRGTSSRPSPLTGRAVVYVSTRTGATELFAQNLIGLTPGPAPAVQLTFDGLIKSHPSWGATATHPGPVGAPTETPLPRPTVGTASPAAS